MLNGKHNGQLFSKYDLSGSVAQQKQLNNVFTPNGEASATASQKKRGDNDDQ